MTIGRYLILSQSDWGNLFSNRKVTGSAYLCIVIGYALLYINDRQYILSGHISFGSFYALSIFSILTILIVGIYRKNFYAIPLAIIGFNALYVITNIVQSIIYEIPINVVTVCYSVLYFIINSLIFRLGPALVLNLCVFSAVAICAAYSAPSIATTPGGASHSWMANALVLSAASLLLQHLVLTVRSILMEQLGSIRLQMAALEAEMQIENARKEAREKTARLNRISVVEALGASIAHEINQPIAAALTYCQAARNWSEIECCGAPETLQALAGVESNVDRAARLIDNIRLLTTKKDREYALADVHELVSDQVNLVHAEFVRRGIALVLEPATQTVKALVCAPEIALATINLLRNAMEAFDGPAEGSVVAVDCRRTGPGWIEIRIADNGRGLPPEGIQSAFGAFQTTKEAGAGIGLAICQEVAEHHSGSISLTVNSQGGLTATLRLADNPAIE